MMISTSWRKAFRDIWENKARALLVVVALVAGIAAVGTTAVAYSILPREMDRNYLQTDPASATLWIESADVDLARRVAEQSAIGRAEARGEIVGRYQLSPGEWRELWLYVIPDFDAIQLDRLTPEAGAWPPAAGDILLERTAVAVAGATVGDRVIVKIPNRPAQALTFSGTVHTPGLPPAWVEGRVYGYITAETLELLGGGRALNQIKFQVAADVLDKDHIQRTTEDLVGWLNTQGVQVSRVDIPEPGKHVHADLMAAFITMLGAMGLMALLMSGVLVTVMMTAVVGQQVRQIAIMKAIGGDTRQIAGIYVVMVLALGLTALTIGLPISIALGRALAQYEAVQMLNFEIFNDSVDGWAYALIVATGVGVPLLAAAGPILQGSRTTVLAALTDYGVSKSRFGVGRVDVWVSNVRGSASALLLSLRNAFRRRSRLLLTLLILAVAGANFMTAVNVATSIDRSIAIKFDATPYDIEVAFSRVYPPEAIDRAIGQVAGVARVETWGGALAHTVRADGSPGKPLPMIAPEIGSELAPDLVILAGRWLQPDDRNAIVVSQAVLDRLDLPATVGGTIVLDLGGRRTDWVLVGVSQEFLANGAYVSRPALAQDPSFTTRTVVQVTDRTQTRSIARDLELRLEDAGLDVYTLWMTDDTRKVMEDHMILITGFLLTMSALFAVIGGLGLASTMSLNVLDRTREIGVMRAIGATTRDVLQIILVEGALIGALSWGAAAVLSVPTTALMGEVFRVMLEYPISLATSWAGWLIWLAAIVVIGMVASAFPAGWAARRPVQATLAYE